MDVSRWGQVLAAGLGLGIGLGLILAYLASWQIGIATVFFVLGAAFLVAGVLKSARGP
jgi:hypothetical protein